MKNLLKELQSESEKGNLDLLTYEKAKSFKSKKVQTIYFGYKGQDGINEFVIGDIVKQHTLFTNQSPEFQKQAAQKYKFDYELLTDEGKPTYIRCNMCANNPNKGVFYCSDEDRFVEFRIIE